jgi:hypothetical protein
MSECRLAATVSPVDRLLADYRRYLLFERGLATTTVDGYECIARVFLRDRERRCGGGLELERRAPSELSRQSTTFDGCSRSMCRAPLRSANHITITRGGA